MGFRANKGIFYLSLAGLMIMMVGVFSLETLVNARSVKLQIINRIQAKIDIGLSPDNLEVSIFPHLGIQLNQIALSPLENLKFKIDSLGLHLSPKALLTGEVRISHVQITGLNLELDPAQKIIPPSRGGRPPFFKHLIPTIFDQLPGKPDRFSMDLTGVSTPFFSDLSAQISLDRSLGSLSMEGTCSNLDIQKKKLPTGSLPKGLPVIGIQAAQSRFKFKMAPDLVDAHLEFSQPELEPSTPLPQPITAPQLELTFSQSKDKTAFLLAPLDLDYPKARVAVDFSTDPQESKIVFSGEGINVDQARLASMKTAGKIKLVHDIFNIVRGGHARAVRVAFKSPDMERLWNAKTFKLTGSLDQGKIKIPNTQLVATQVDGAIQIENGTMEIQAKKARAGTSIVKTKDLSINLTDHEDFPFQGNFDLSVDLKTLVKTLSKVLSPGHLMDELSKISKAQGQVKGRLFLGLKHKAPLKVIVKAPEFSGDFSYDRIPFPVHIDKGDFFLEDDTLALNNFSGRMATSVFEDLTAKIQFIDNGPMELKQSRGKIDIGKILPWAMTNTEIKNFLSPLETARGTLDVDHFSMTGHALEPHTWKYKAMGRIQSMDAQLAGEKNALVKTCAQFDVTPELVLFDQLESRITGLKFLDPFTGAKERKSICLPLDLSKGSLKWSPEKTKLGARLKNPSNVELYLSLGGDSLGNMGLLGMEIEDGQRSGARLSLNKSPKGPLMDFQGKLDSRSLGALLVHPSFLSQKLKTLTGGIPIQVTTDIFSNIHFKAKALNLDSLMGDSKKARAQMSKPYFKKRYLFFETQTLTYKQKKYKDVKAQVYFQNQFSNVKIDNLSLCNVNLKGNVTFVEINGEPRILPQLTIKNKKNARLEELTPCFYGDQKLMEGPYSLECKIQGNSPEKLPFAGLEGRISLGARKGRIYKLTLLSRLLSVFNLLNLPDLVQEGFAFKKISIQGKIKKGVIYLDQAVIDAENMALIFDGWIDPGEETLQLTCLIAPFKTIDTIIQHIPIVNTILKGRLASFPARIQGKFKDPVITPLHPSDVGKGLINILEDVITAPERLFKEVQ